MRSKAVDSKRYVNENAICKSKETGTAPESTRLTEEKRRRRRIAIEQELSMLDIADAQYNQPSRSLLLAYIWEHEFWSLKKGSVIWRISRE